MKRIVFAVCVLAAAGFQTPGQTSSISLPKGAVVLETRKLNSTSHPNRSLVLWMLNPKKNPTSYGRNDTYSCPDYTRGSHYSGATRVSLIDSTTKRIINTTRISGSSEDDGDSFDLPYAIRAGFYYRVVPRPREAVEAKPNIIWLKDYNGDGKALEFALFDAEACMGLQTTLIGYSERQDRVIQYPIKLELMFGTRQGTKMTPWADYLFSKRPLRPGYWKYEVDYRGRAGSLNKWEIRYNAAQERFEGKLIVIPGD